MDIVQLTIELLFLQLMNVGHPVPDKHPSNAKIARAKVS